MSPTGSAPDEVVVVSGASGGVGLTACQLAQHRGAVVIGLAGARNEALLRQHSVSPVTYGDGQDNRIRQAAADAPIDAFNDCYGSGYVDLALALGVPRSRIYTVVDFDAAKDNASRQP